jgi:hypothetical protein
MKAFFISTTGDSQLPKSDGTNFLFTPHGAARKDSPDTTTGGY